METIAICHNLLVGYGARSTTARVNRFFVLPLLVAIAFFMIADLDASRSGVIRVRPQNPVTLSSSLPTQ
jgi:hypothetical protein